MSNLLLKYNNFDVDALRDMQYSRIVDVVGDSAGEMLQYQTVKNYIKCGGYSIDLASTTQNLDLKEITIGRRSKNEKFLYQKFN